MVSLLSLMMILIGGGGGGGIAEGKDTPVGGGYKFPLPGVIPDLFIAVAPLIVGVVCKDGVLLIALHTAFSTDTDDKNDESFLLFKQQQQQQQIQSEERQNSTIPIGRQQKDLPRSYRGPFRIYPIDTTNGQIALTCAGWRTDGYYLKQYLQSVDKKERQVFGSLLDVDEHGSYLACQASQFLAEICVQDGRRPMSCLGLLAAGGGGGGGTTINNNNNSGGGCLYLVDASGAYRVRAHAVGGGPLLAGKMNDILREKDWTQFCCVDVAKELLCTLFDDLDDKTNESKDTSVDIPEGSLVEIVSVGSTTQGIGTGLSKRKSTLNRIFTSTLFGSTTTTRN
jgi:20S proteasome alpha/beta subunit